MKTSKSIFLIALLLIGQFAVAQFTNTVGNITQITPGNVGIGTSTPTKNLEIGGVSPVLYMNGTTSNNIMFTGAGLGTPTFTTRSAGTKLILYPGLSSTLVDYALGIVASTLWFSSPATTSSFKWYGGQTEQMRLQEGKLGIGTSTTPVATLQVKNGSVLFDGTTGTTPTSGDGTRMMWIPAKAAFRAGLAVADYWDDVNIGTYSFACNSSTKATGYASIASGYNSLASGNYSTAQGFGTLASGVGSFAVGGSAKATSGWSFSAGNNTTASGGSSSAFGTQTVAQSYACFVIGQHNYNPGTYNPSSWVETDPIFVIGNGGYGVPQNAVTILKNGNIGIGVTNPTTTLAIKDNENQTVLGSNTNSAIKIMNTQGVIGRRSELQFGITESPNEQLAVIASEFTSWNVGAGGALLFATKASTSNTMNERMRIDATGKVLIGKTTPNSGTNYILDVNGNVRANEIIINTTGADFVFENNYELMPLNILEQKIKADKHLPGIANAKEMQENGVGLGELNTLLLQKVEELTLYIIDLKKEMNELKKAKQ